MPSIADLRKQIGPAAESFTDEELFGVVRDVYTSLGAKETDVARNWGYDPNRDFSRGLEMGFRNTGAAFAGAGAAAADALGATGARESMLGFARGQQQRAMQLGRTYDDVDNFAQNPLGFLSSAAGQAVGYAVPSLVGGGVGGLAAKAIGRGALAGYGLGAGAANLAQETGGIYGELAEQGKYEPGRALAYGLPAAALDTASEMVPWLRGVGAGGLGRRVARGVLTQAGSEAATEVGQTAIERAGAYKDVLGPDAMHEYRNAAALGAIGGGMFGGVAGLRPAPRQISSDPGQPTDLLADGGWTTSRGFDAPASAEQPAPLGDLTPDWQTSLGAGAKAEPGVDFSGAYPAVGEPPLTWTTARRGEQPLSGMPGVDMPPLVADEFGAVAGGPFRDSLTRGLEPGNPAQQANALYGRENGDPGVALARQRYEERLRQAEQTRATSAAVQAKVAENQADVERAMAHLGGKVKPGSKALGLFKELEAQRDAGVIDEDTFVGDLALLSQSQLGAVRKNIDARNKEQADAASTGTNGAAGAADLGRSAGDQRAPGQSGGVRPAQPGTAAQGVVRTGTDELGPRGVGGDAALSQPVIGTGAADAAARVERVLGRELTPEQRKLATKLAQVSPRTAQMLQDMLGLDAEWHQTGTPMSVRDVGAKYGVSGAAVHKALKKLGIQAEQVQAATAAAPGQTVSGSELLANADEGGPTGFRVSDQVNAGADDFELDARTQRDQKATDAFLKDNDGQTAGTLVDPAKAQREVEIEQRNKERAVRGLIAWLDDPANASNVQKSGVDWDDAKSDNHLSYNELPLAVRALWARDYLAQLEETGNEWDPIQQAFDEFVAARSDQVTRGQDSRGVEGGRGARLADGAGRDGAGVRPSGQEAEGTRGDESWGNQLASAEQGGAALDRSATTRTTREAVLAQAPYAKAAGDLKALGLGHMLDWVGEWRTAGNRDVDVADGWLEGYGSQYVLTLKDAESMGSAANASWVMLHELGHAADLAPSGGVYSAHPDLRFEVVDGRAEGRGAVAAELAELYDNDPWWATTLAYPMDVNAYGATDGETVAAEAFAQLFAMYVHPKGRAKLQLDAPLAFQFIEESVNDIQATRPLRIRTPGEIKGRTQAFARRYRGVSTGQSAGTATGRNAGDGGRALRAARDNDPVGRDTALRRLYDRARETYDEFTSPGDAYDALYEAATPGEQRILRALKADDFLGFDYPHQAVREVQLWMRGDEYAGDYDISPQVKAAVSALGNRFGTSAFRSAANTAAAQVEALNKVTEALPQPAKNAWTDVKDFAARKLPYVLTTFQIFEQFGAKLPKLREMIHANDLMRQEAISLQMQVDEIVKRWDKLPKAAGELLSQVAQRATLLGAYPDKAWDSEDNAHVDRDRKAEYDELVKLYTQLKATSPQALKVYDDALAAFEAQRQQLEAAAKQMFEKYGKVMPAVKRVPGPYFPLVRRGDYLAIGESTRLRGLKDQLEKAQEANAPEDQLADLRESIDQLEADGQSFWVSSHETRSAMEQALRDYESRGLTARASLASQRLDGLPTRNLHSTIANLTAEATKNLSKDGAKEVGNALAEILLRSLPEGHALERQAARRGVAGAMDDMKRAVAIAGRQNAYYIARLNHAKEAADALAEMGRSVKGDVDLQHVHRELEQRHALNLQWHETPFQDAIGKAAWTWFLGASPTFLLMNMAQPWLISAPVMAGKYGAGAASRELARGTRDAFAALKKARWVNGKLDLWSGIDTDSVEGRHMARNADGKMISEDRKALRELIQRGVIDEGLAPELAMYAESGGTGLLTKLSRLMGWPAQQVELVNRVGTGLAAFRLERAKRGPAGETAEQAYQRAVDAAYATVVNTHVDYGAENAPRAMREGGGIPLAKLVFQFRRYQQAMFYLLAANVKKLRDPAEQKAARATLAYLALTSAMSAGAIGLPFMGTAMFLADLFGDDDDEEGDAKTRMRNALRDMTGSKEFADVLAKGLPAMFGVDIAERVGLGQVGQLFPRLDLSRNKTAEDKMGKALVALAGPAGGLGTQALDAASYFGAGDFLRGTERLLPKMFADPVRAMREQARGMEDRKGEQVMASEELTIWDTTRRLLGASSIAESDRYEASKAVQDVERGMSVRRDRIHAEFRRALRSGDFSNVREMITEFNADHPRQPIKPKDEAAWRKEASRAASQRDPETGIKLTRRQQPLAELQRFAQ